MLWASAGSSSDLTWTGEWGSCLIDTGMRGTLEERLGDLSAGLGLGTVGVSITEDNVGKDRMSGSASTGSVFSSFTLTGGASSLSVRDRSSKYTF